MAQEGHVERILHEDGGVEVTDRRIRFRGRDLAIDQVNSTQVVHQARSLVAGCLAVLFMLAGLGVGGLAAILLAGTMEAPAAGLLTGGPTCLVSLALLTGPPVAVRMMPTVYMVTVRAGGAHIVLRTKDADRAERMQHAIGEAQSR